MTFVSQSTIEIYKQWITDGKKIDVSGKLYFCLRIPLFLPFLLYTLFIASSNISLSMTSFPLRYFYEYSATSSCNRSEVDQSYMTALCTLSRYQQFQYSIWIRLKQPLLIFLRLKVFNLFQHGDLPQIDHILAPYRYFLRR